MLEAKWVERTSGTPFHAKDCDSNFGDYKRNSNDENKSLYADLTGILADSGLGGYAAVLDLASRREVFPEVEDMDWSYYKAFQETVEHMKNCANFNGETVKFTFDTREQSIHNTGILFRLLQGIPDWQKIIVGGLTFEHATTNPRLQAADLFVREVMKAWDNRVGPIKRAIRKSWKRLLQTERFHGEVLGLEWFYSLQDQMPEMEKITGMSMDAYATWLNDRGLQCDNVTNCLLYIDWLDAKDTKNATREKIERTER
jgi:hypothetical protein